MNEVKISELKKEISELKIQLTEEKSWLKQYFGWHEKQEALLKEQEATLKEQEKELGYYRWYELNIEQHFPDTFYDMRNGNEYNTRVGCRAAYRKEMELKEIVANIEVPDGFVLKPPKMITPENLEDGSIWE